MPRVESSPINYSACFRSYREQAGLTQDHVAQRAGITRTTISNLENNVTFAPKPDTLNRLLSLFTTLADAQRPVSAEGTIVFEAPPSSEPEWAVDLSDRPPSLPRPTPPNPTYSALEGLLDRHLAQYPDKPVVLAELAQELGKSRERVRQLYAEIAATKPVLPIKIRAAMEARNNPQATDQKIAPLIAQGLDESQIATQLGLPQAVIHETRMRIQKAASQVRRTQIKTLRDQGYGERQIGEATGLPRGVIGGILSQLVKAGEVKRVRKKYRSRSEAAAFKEYITLLRLDPRNLTIVEIGAITGESVTNIVHYLNELIQEGRIQRARGKRISEAMKRRWQDPNFRTAVREGRARARAMKRAAQSESVSDNPAYSTL